MSTTIRVVTTVEFICTCGEELSTMFNKDYYNYHTVGCTKCGFMYEVPRPNIVEHWNLCRADKQWLKENGFEKAEG